MYNTENRDNDLANEFATTAVSIGSRVYQVNAFDEIVTNIEREFVVKGRIFSNIAELSAIAETSSHYYHAPHSFEDVELNRLIGDEHLSDDGIKDGQWPDWITNGTPRTSGRYTFATFKHYSKDSPLFKSGLLGPVTIQEEKYK
jgi:hypothetical protein